MRSIIYIYIYIVKGTDGNFASETVKRENPSVKSVQIVPAGSMVTMDVRQDRVRIFVDDNKRVVSAPRIG